MNDLGERRYQPPRSRARARSSASVRRIVAIAALVAVAGGATAAALGGGSRRTVTGSVAASPRPQPRAARRHPASQPSAAVAAPRPTVKSPTGPPFAVGLQVLRVAEPGRSIRPGGGSPQPRSVVTLVRYPALGAAGASDVRGAAPARSAGPFPLVVFGHGFDISPGPYDRLLRAWVRAGYVVAAPVFPLENPGAPGGPDESDLPNQAGDMSAVITRLLSDNATSGRALSGMISRRAIAAAGQSDGGDTALTVAFHVGDRDPRVTAVVVLSGAEVPGLGGYRFPPGGPALLATQGTDDTINPPDQTDAFFAAAAPPKYLVRLLGAGHLPPYTDQQPQLGIVERVTTDFLDRYLKGRTSAQAKLTRAAQVPGLATLTAEP